MAASTRGFTKEELILNKQELIDSITTATGESKKAVSEVLNSTIDTIKAQVSKGERVSLPGFGTFERRDRNARTARNPQTGDPIDIPATQVPAFKAGSEFKSSVAGKRKKK
jgi:DNA-binding protein HU-beta